MSNPHKRNNIRHVHVLHTEINQLFDDNRVIFHLKKKKKKKKKNTKKLGDIKFTCTYLLSHFLQIHVLGYSWEGRFSFKLDYSGKVIIQKRKTMRPLEAKSSFLDHS